MDIALKQRLVGASVLVALGVIFIPMLLDGPGQGDDGSRIPDPPEQRFESRLLPVNPSERPPPEARDEPAPSATVDSTPPMPVTRLEVDEPGPESIEPAPARAEPPPLRQSDSAAPAVPAGGEGDWLVQLGSFGNAANAARLVARLEEAGYPGYQEKVAVGDQTLYRVRVGYWSSKEAATAAGQWLGETMGDVDASVRQRTDDAPEPAPLTGWMVQVGSFSSQDNAFSLRDRLRAAGFDALVESVGQGDDRAFRVRVGPEIERSSAESVQRRLREEMGLSGILVDHP